MFGVNDLEITLYFCGTDKDHAQEGMPFDSIESAESYANDNGYKVFEAQGMIDLTTLSPVDEEEEDEVLFKIVRMYQDPDKDTKVIATDLTFEEAREHCNDPSTRGDGWFDGYTEQ